MPGKPGRRKRFCTHVQFSITLLYLRDSNQLSRRLLFIQAFLSTLYHFLPFSNKCFCFLSFADKDTPPGEEGDMTTPNAPEQTIVAPLKDPAAHTLEGMHLYSTFI